MRSSIADPGMPTSNKVDKSTVVDNIIITKRRIKNRGKNVDFIAGS